jgi:hypothetical protein
MTNETKKDMADVAADVQVLRRKEVTGNLNFVEDLDALDAALEADTIVVRFRHPTDPEGKHIDFEMQPMTPGQFAIYYQTLLGYSLLEGTPTDETPELDDEQLQDKLAVNKYDARLLNILESNILHPPGITAERIRKWDPFYIMRLHNALIGGSRPSKTVAQFSGLDPERK